MKAKLLLLAVFSSVVLAACGEPGKPRELEVTVDRMYFAGLNKQGSPIYVVWWVDPDTRLVHSKKLYGQDESQGVAGNYQIYSDVPAGGKSWARITYGKEGSAYKYDFEIHLRKLEEVQVVTSEVSK